MRAFATLTIENLQQQILAPPNAFQELSLFFVFVPGFIGKPVQTITLLSFSIDVFIIHDLCDFYLIVIYFYDTILL